MTKARLVFTLSFILLFVGCSGSNFIPSCDRPFTDEERIEISMIADYISNVGEKWGPYAEVVHTLLEIDRMCVGDLGKYDAWAQWAPMKTRIINDPSFFDLYTMDAASVLVVEAAHILHKSTKTHYLQVQFLNDARAKVG